jgi:ribose 5-phosphate isomerase B
VIVACAFDHAGVPFHERVVAEIAAAGHEPVDLGTADDYPDVALAVGLAIHQGRAERGILVCGSGAGVAVAACKLEGIRATVAHEPYTGAQCVSHDDCNVICMGARVIGPEIAAMVIQAFLGEQFSQATRHRRRVAKIAEMELHGLSAHLDEIGDPT